ncbi:MAG: class I SAM-dependent methyltransferase [Candidatus Micrarchaeota archaeon]
MRTVTAISELRAIDEAVGEICSGLPIYPGSIFRIASQYLPNYGIAVTGENRAFIESESSVSYALEWAPGDDATNKAIERAIGAAAVAVGNVDMNRYVADTARDLIVALSKKGRTLNILDVGAGSGDTTCALLDALEDGPEAREAAKSCYFFMLEPSIYRLECAVTEAEKKGINKAVFDGRIAGRLRKLHRSLEEFLDGRGRNKFDVVISSAALHHFSFGTHYQKLYDMMADDGVLVIGDWHNNLLAHPANVARLIRDLGASQEQVRRFELLFDIRTDDVHEFEMKLSDTQRKANRDFRNFVVAMANEMRCFDDSGKLFFLEALELIDERVEKIRSAGFETDIDQLRKEHHAFANVYRTRRRIVPHNDVAYVVTAGKVPKQ